MTLVVVPFIRKGGYNKAKVKYKVYNDKQDK